MTVQVDKRKERTLKKYYAEKHATIWLTLNEDKVEVLFADGYNKNTRLYKRRSTLGTFENLKSVKEYLKEVFGYTLRFRRKLDAEYIDRVDMI